MRLYEETGPVVLTVAASSDEALAYLQGLKALHQPYWNQRGRPGAFACPFFEAFHKALIRRCFDDGGIQLVRIAAGEDVIGYIYHFVAGGTVYQYQSGFRYDDDPKLKPGLVSHYRAIAYNLERGADIYDFLAGESQHKKSLGTHTTEMDWLVLQRRRLKFVVENHLRDIKHRLAASETA
jgi:CelD/BcsL family acetyltransferase involved in cellulose biosynthesis